MHEFGHALAARQVGGESREIILWPFGGIAFAKVPPRPGAELWAAELPASGHATPMTYMGKDGKQYVVTVAAGGTSVGGGLPISDALVAFRLP